MASSPIASWQTEEEKVEAVTDFIWGATKSPRIATAALVAQVAKNRPAMQETRFRSLGQEDTLEKEMTTLSSILAWEIP